MFKTKRVMIGDGTSSLFVINTKFSKDVYVQVTEVITGRVSIPDIYIQDNVVTVEFFLPIKKNSYEVFMMGDAKS